MLFWNSCERGSLNSNTKRKIDYYTNLLNKKLEEQLHQVQMNQ